MQQSQPPPGGDIPETPASSDGPDTDAIIALGKRHGFTPAAAMELWRALCAGHGSMAQFSHADLGGSGQWMRGGLTTVGDMFNHDLAARVHAICSVLADLVPEFADTEPAPLLPGDMRRATASQARWPESWGTPSAIGAQDNLEYAWFPHRRQLWVRRHGHAAVYNTGEHRIFGVSQQQGDAHSLVFTSQFGPVDLETLEQAQGEPPETESPAQPLAMGAHEILETLTKLAELRSQGVLTPEEFKSKKEDLLKRL